MSRPTRYRGGFTLIELLAVLIVLAGAATLSVGALGRTYGAHAERLAVSTVTGALERTRLLAEGRGGAELHLGPTLVAAPRDTGIEPARIRFTLPRGWSAGLADSIDQDATPSVIRFDADGACGDVDIVVHGPHEQTRTLRVLGLSGQVIELTTAPGEGSRLR